MPEPGYAIDMATQVDEIEFPRLVSDLINGVFGALIDAEITQQEAFADLLSKVSKELTQYINETKLEQSDDEILSYLEDLPAFIVPPVEPSTNAAIADQTAGDEYVAETSAGSGTPAALDFSLGQMAPLGAILQLGKNVSIEGISEGVKDAFGAVADIKNLVGGLSTADDPDGVQAAAGLFPYTDGTYYDPTKLDTIVASPGNNVTLASKIEMSDAAIKNLYDAIADRIAGNKYATLNNLVKMGTAKLKIDDGLLVAAMTFRTYERFSESESKFQKHKLTTMNKSKTVRRGKRGFLKILQRRDLDKTKNRARELRVKTAKESRNSSAGTDVTIMSRVELRFSTDYQPISTI